MRRISFHALGLVALLLMGCGKAKDGADEYAKY